MSEDDLLAAVARVHERVDPVPDFIREAARAAFATRDPDAGLAELVADGVLEESVVRTSGGPRLLTFRAEGFTLDLEVHQHGARRRVLGQVSPAGPGLLRACVGDSDGDVPLDARGRFVLDDLPAVAFRLRWAPEVGPPVVTSWITL